MHHSLQDATQNQANQRAGDASLRIERDQQTGRRSERADHHHPPAPTRDQAPRPAHTGEGDTCERIRRHVIEAMGANRVRRYLNERTAMRQLDATSIEICAGDAFTLDMIQRRLGDALRVGAQFALGTTEPVIRYRTDADLQPAGGTETPERGNLPASGAARLVQPLTPAGGAPSTAPARANAERCPRLEEFIVGASNRLAFESVRQCIEAPTAGVPVFIHGTCGVGKTHLLRGATMLMRRVHPGAKVRYTTGEAFTNAFVKAIRTRSVEAFQKKYRNLDLLCIDDIHLMAGKQATQHELLQIFNMLSLGGARIILASDAHPRTIARFDQSLSSRFSSGLVVRVDEPDAELAQRLVHRVAQKRGMMVDDTCARMICERIGIGRGASVRDIEGALVQIQAVSQLLERDHSAGARAGMSAPSVGHIRKALALRSGEDTAMTSAPLSLDAIIRTVCDELSVSVSDLKGRGRRKKVVLARELIVHLARQLTSKSFPEIAHAIGRPNHSTVITAAKRFKDRLGACLTVDADCPFDGLPLTELTQRLTRSVQQG